MDEFAGADQSLVAVQHVVQEISHDDLTDLRPVPTGMWRPSPTIVDPIPRLSAIEPSDDPLLELRAAVYLISGRRRRAA